MKDPSLESLNYSGYPCFVSSGISVTSRLVFQLVDTVCTCW